VDEGGTVAKGINNGKSYIRFSKVQFFRPEAVAAEYTSTDGDTGLVQAVVFEVRCPPLDASGLCTTHRCSRLLSISPAGPLRDGETGGRGGGVDRCMIGTA
jgi:hypothetical protein